MSRALEERIAAVASRQHGVVTRAQLIDAGLSPAAVGRRITAGRLRRLHRGVYLVGAVAPPWSREMAAVLASGPAGLLGYASAGSFWELRPAQKASELVEIALVGTNRDGRPGIRFHRVRRLHAAERTVRHGIPVTSPARTLLDLTGVVGSRELEQAVARAEREGLVDREGLLSLLARHRGRRGTRALRALLESRDGPALTRSEAEEKFLSLVLEAGLPTPEANVRIDRYELDFLWRAEGIAVEVDGFRHHSSRPRFEGDRRKDARLLAGGIKIVRLTWGQIVNEATATAVQVGQALVRAAGERGTLGPGR